MCGVRVIGEEEWAKIVAEALLPKRRLSGVSSPASCISSGLSFRKQTRVDQDLGDVGILPLQSTNPIGGDVSALTIHGRLFKTRILSSQIS